MTPRTAHPFRTRLLVAAPAVLCLALAAPPPGGMFVLARSGEWSRILEVASRRGEQLPLSAPEAMVAAHAARRTGDVEAEKRFLESVLAGGSQELEPLAAVLLAEAIARRDPERALELALPRFDRASTLEVRNAAGEVVTDIVEAGLGAPERTLIERSLGKLPDRAARRLELALALADSDQLSGMERLLKSSTRDLPALEAAEFLLAIDPLPAALRWKAAVALFDHGLYERAAPHLEDLGAGREPAVPAHEVAFLRGRCAFRLGRWEEAARWYARAAALAPSAGRRAEIELHIGRASELAGDLEGAVEAALRAVALDADDDYRLFLARLRLQQDELELATRGLARLRSRRARDQGQVLLGLWHWRRGEEAAAASHFDNVRRPPWNAAAVVLGAELALAGGRHDDVLRELDAGWSRLGPFWEEQARRLVVGLPPELLAEWRRQRLAAAGAATGRSRWLELARWATLEVDPEALAELRRQVARELPSGWGVVEPSFERGTAAELWRIGLEGEAAAWDARGFPRSDAAASAWTASRFLELDLPWRSVRDADGAWRQLGSEMPIRALPTLLQRAAFPLPDPSLVRMAAAGGGIHWSLLAAVVREESRWDPSALSAVGARGLSQLMPATAVAAAGRLGRPAPAAAELFEVGTNLTLGGSELGRLVQAFDGSPAPAVAAYNAGEAQARIWLGRCGNGCSDGRYVAGISFAATRAYTAAVLAAASVYEELYGPMGAVSD